MKMLIARTANATLLTATLALGAAGPAASDPLATVNDWSGNWRGTYTCNQGVTGIFLNIKASGDDVTAVVTFFAVPENPDVPRGEFEMAGQPGAANHLALFPMRWIKAPPGYLMVGLEGAYDEATSEYSGRIYGVGCSRFTLHRAAAGDEPPPAPPEKTPTADRDGAGGKNAKEGAGGRDATAGERDGPGGKDGSGGRDSAADEKDGPDGGDATTAEKDGPGGRNGDQNGLEGQNKSGGSRQSGGKGPNNAETIETTRRRRR